MGGYAKERAQEQIAEVVGQSLDLVAFWRECTEAISPAVRHYLGPSWFTLDPASLLVTSHFQQRACSRRGRVRARPFPLGPLDRASRNRAGVRRLTPRRGHRGGRSPGSSSRALDNGDRGRRDLVGKVFFTHHEPRVRDNEQRVTQGQPVRGGPLTAGK